jgi:hypothetical protein
MARGWESKAVEDQISAREADAGATGKVKRTPLEREKQARRDGLLLARVHTVSAMDSARDPRYRAQLESALAHLDSQIADLD